MEKLQKKLTASSLVFVISSALLVLLSRTGLRRTLSLLRWARTTSFGVARLLRTEPRVLLVPGLFLLLLLAALAAAVVCVRSFLKMARLSAQGGARPTDSKYIRQLDEMLKSGLIDRAEYRALREKYERMEQREGR